MGIPSFYRHLCRRFPRLVSAGPHRGADWLCLDFNCAMYYVLRQQPPIAEAKSPAAWEADFAKAIADYMREIILLARPSVGVYVSCDGVVCAAKRRQQRLRRFKGPWIAAAEAAVRAQAGDTAAAASRSGWDQNALTPGTAFMSMLGDVLTREGARIAAREGIQVTVSTTSEPGEGEHKLLRAMRSLTPAPRSCVIYGLDADLILLAMLLGTDTGAVVHLMREAQEFEVGSRGAEGEVEWRCLSIGELVRVLLPAGASASRVRDFVCGMSLLGNDFLPRSLTKTVRDDGIPALIGVLDREVWTRGLHLVGLDGTVHRNALAAIVGAWAATEDTDLLMTARDAARAAGRPAGIADSPAETAVREWSAQPARWAAVTRLLITDGRPDGLSRRRAIYGAWRPGSAANYCAGVAWVWDYYSGRAVDQGWVFEEHLPPLWADVAAWLRESPSAVVSAPPIEHPEALPEWLHLLAVLPMDSVRRLLPLAKHTLALSHPWYWPSQWSLFDVGRTQMWECEAVIPLIPERLLRSVAAGAAAKK